MSRDMLRYVGFHDFGGVDLSASPDEPGCIDQLNVEALERKGAVYTRPAWMNRGPGLDSPIVAFQHGQVQDGAAAGDISVYLTTADSSWLGPALPDDRPLRVASNELVISPPLAAYTTGSATYDLTASDVEVYATIKDATSPPKGSYWLFARWNKVTAEGLFLLVYRFSQVALFRRVGGVSTSLGVGSITSSSGAQVALRILGDAAEVWHKAVAGSWTKVLDVPSVGYAHAGAIGLGAAREAGGEPSLDDFGGGAIDTPNIAPATPILDDFDRADETPVGGAPSLVAYNRDQDTSVSATVAASMFLDAVQFSGATKSVILATENVKTATNIGINVIEVDDSDPFVTITPMAASGGPALDWVRFIDVQQPDIRAVAVGVADGVTHEARVWFSDPVDYTTWGADNYVDLSPNDGEVFTGTANFRGQLWVFKESQAFCFYGNSVDNVGGPVFNYRAIDLGTRCVPRNLSGSYAYGEGVVAGEAGIYFVGTDGVYLIDGRDSVKISQPVDAIMKGYWATSGQIGAGTNQLSAGLHYVDRRLFVNLGGTILVWDEQRRGWLIWQAPVDGGSVCPVPWIGAAGVDDPSPALALFGHSDGNNLWGLARLSERDQIKDGDAAIPARYRHGFYDLGSDYIDRIEETRVTGTGEVAVTVSKDFEPVSEGLSETLDLGGGTSYLEAPTQKRFKHGLSGVVFSHQIEGDAPWAVHRVVQAVSSQKAAGTR